jgi:hypothetical protein
MQKEVRAIYFIDEPILTSLSMGKYSITVATSQLNLLQVTPGIFDMHSHIGVDSAPELRGISRHQLPTLLMTDARSPGSDDTNSIAGVTQPWLRSLDGLNTHDESVMVPPMVTLHHSTLHSIAYPFPVE